MPETTNITEEHRRSFEALTSGKFDNFCLFSCTANDHPAAAIAAVTVQPSPDGTGEDEYLVTPIFVSLGPGITLVDHDGPRRRPWRAELAPCSCLLRPLEPSWAHQQR